MKFLEGINKDLKKAGLEEGSSGPPRYWFSLGNYVLNKITSGNFKRGIPQGRVTGLTGPSQSGKSFLAVNAMREAQKEGAHLVVLDTENAMDDNFVSDLGVDPTNGYSYYDPITIPQVKKIVSAVIRGYKKEYGNDPDAPKMLFVIDSLDMLITETEQKNWDKGETKGDQGQRNKQLKAMLREFVQAIKRLNISIIVTSQVYRNQDLTNGEGVWVVSEAIKYSLSQILLLTKLKLKVDEKGKKTTIGMRMKTEGYKTRFTKPFQVVTIEVPYDEGMDPYNGLIDVAKELGVLEQRGSYLGFVGVKGESFYAKEFDEHAERCLELCDAKGAKFLEAFIDDDEIAEVEETRSVGQQRKDNLKKISDKLK